MAGTLPVLALLLLGVFDGGGADAASAQASARSLVRASAATRIPNDPFFSMQWGSRNTGQMVNGISGTAGADDRAAEAWTVTTGSPSIVIAEVDTGVDYTHPDLAANIWSNPGGIGGCPAGTHGFDVVAGENACDPMDDDTAYNGHGTHVAGIIGGVGNNSRGVTGMNWRTAILPVKWLDSNSSGSTAQLISALDWVLKAKRSGVNVRVVNDSITFVGTAYSQALADEIDLLGSNGILFVTPAGNTSQDDDTTPRYPCGYDRPTEICVAASDQNDKLPSWANWGPRTVDLAAPGDNIYSTLRNDKYGYISGSSMAAAQVSGAAGLALSSENMSTTALKADILGSADRLPSLAGKVRTGGRLDVCKAIPACATPAPPAPPVKSTPAPAVKSFSVKPKHLSVVVRRGRRRLGATAFRFTLNEPASVVIVIQRRVAGRFRGRRCVAGIGSAARRRRCTLYVQAARISMGTTKAGVGVKRWVPHRGRSILAAGAYRADIQASNRGGRSRARTAIFTITSRAT